MTNTNLTALRRTAEQRDATTTIPIIGMTDDMAV
jgi:hypothetical protein